MPDADDDAAPSRALLGASTPADNLRRARSPPPDVFVSETSTADSAVMASLAAAHGQARRPLTLVTHEWLANEPTFRGWGFPPAHNARALPVATPRGRRAGRRSGRARLVAVVVGRGSVAREMTLAGLAATMRARGGAPRNSGVRRVERRTGRTAAAGPKPARAVTPESRAVVAASAAMDAVALGADVDAAKGTAMDWDAVREVVGGCYGDAGMRGLAAFVRREDA